MTTLNLLIASPFRESSQNAASWLISHKPAVLLLTIPRELDNCLRAYCEKEITLEDFLQDFALLTGLADPHIEAFIYWWTPLLKVLQKVHNAYKMKVKCYWELNHFLTLKKISEEVFFQSFKTRATDKIDIDKWKTIFQKKYAVTNEITRSCVENILENVELNHKNAILFRDTHRYISKCIKEGGYLVKYVYLQKYWRPPLTVLQMLFELYGGHVSEKTITKCVRAHLGYLDIVLTRKNLDDAYKLWSKHLKFRNRFAGP